ncbi:NAD-dependent epimerase/dehydratase family protein [Sporosarcina sp. BP05]|uniref:NAD-dependent epimerase/dehydratase family protein n=1 Tax=Sporosarcina sp. BP05 TaxID=2758726 RepID=UPI00164705D4|nr:NAD-dependent epimerase/dehydratase family protein [Sporosarcina sp. BP05]
MKLLVIGGTSFVGRHIVERSLQNGHEVVLFNRGKTNPDLFPKCRHIIGDRRAHMDQAALEHWDAVIDTSGYTPNDVKPVIEALKDKIDHYTFISTISVYDDHSKGDVNENSSTFTHTITTDEVTGETYGPLKVMCEKEVNDGFGSKALIVRPCIIVGPDDPTDRFTYWAMRTVEEGPIAIPGGDRKVQWIDVRDLAKWIVEMIEEKKTGTFNAASQPVSFETFIDELTSEQGTEKIAIPDNIVAKVEMDPKYRFPFWIPISEQYPQGFFIVDASNAAKAGLSIRPLRVTADDTREWAKHLDVEKCKAGPTNEIEKLLINKVMA